MIYKTTLAALAALTLASCASEPPKVAQVGYFKSDANDRVVSCRMDAGATPEDVRAFAEGFAHTEGQMTAVYCYDRGDRIPADALTRAGSVLQANAVLDDQSLDAWRFAFMRYDNGSSRFVDCEATPADDLCRQN